MAVEVAENIGKHGGKVVVASLTATYLTIKAVLTIYSWYKGEISGRRCYLLSNKMK